jgi:hypothetical protein
MTKATFAVLNMGFDQAHSVELFSFPQFVDIDLHTKKYIAAYGDYPSEYRQEDKSDYTFLFPFAVAEEETWASFFHSHCIYVFKQNETKRSICSKSRHLPNEFEFLPRGLRPAERNPKLIPMGEYRNLVYDPFRRLFYRIVVHALPEETNAFKDWNARKRMSWSIMILNEHGDCMIEALFPPGKYDYDRVFATKAGMLVSLENPYNPENEEELLSFELFDLDEIR